MEAFLTSLGLVALAEIGDKTQLLALLLAARFRRPLPIVAGILLATVANHFLASLVGSIAADLLAGAWFRLATGASFVLMGLWTLIPDTLEAEPRLPAHGVFLTTLMTFFLVEMGDKTQVATVALGARFHDVVAVTAGTTLGMLLANAPMVWLGDRLLARVNLATVRRIAAALFVAIGVWTLVEALA